MKFLFVLFLLAVSCSAGHEEGHEEGYYNGHVDGYYAAIYCIKQQRGSAYEAASQCQ